MSSEIILKMDEIPNAREKKKDVVKIPKKKGRKLTPLLLYISQSKVKIKAWRVEMNKPGISKEKKHELRNKASALESRMNKKIQTKNLNESVGCRRLKFEKLTEIITNTICEKCTTGMCSHMQVAFKEQKD